MNWKLVLQIAPFLSLMKAAPRPTLPLDPLWILLSETSTEDLRIRVEMLAEYVSGVYFTPNHCFRPEKFMVVIPSIPATEGLIRNSFRTYWLYIGTCCAMHKQASIKDNMKTERILCMNVLILLVGLYHKKLVILNHIRTKRTKVLYPDDLYHFSLKVTIYHKVKSNL